jgi:2-polyprenyl-6-methoxyphenol hydroxylase-like FAD-dependent oxidoreductase
MRILVVGAGPVGLALTLALHRQGLAARQVDKAPEPSRHSKALGIQARTLEALDSLGVAGPVLAEALRIQGASFHLGPGAPQAFDLSHRLHPRFPSMVILPQSRTEALLAAATGAAGLPPPERGVELAALDPATGAVELRHPDGRTESAVFDHVLGADGAHSTVRKAAGIGFEGARYEEPLVLADGRAEGLAPARLHIFPGHGEGRFYFPLPGGSWRAVVMLPEESRPPPEGDLSHFQLPGLRFFDPVWWSAFRISHRLASSYRSGRACVLGDAAHIHSPAGGQGMNLGIQDAVSLAGALARGEAALAEWAAARRAVAATVLRRTDLLTGMVLGRSPAIRALRAVGLRLLPRLPPARLRLERALSGLDYPAAG